jgi:hypothetical protein
VYTKCGFCFQFHVHSDLDSLHEHFPPTILPDWLGGTLSHDEAMDKELMSRIFSPASDEFYKKYLFPQCIKQ